MGSGVVWAVGFFKLFSVQNGSKLRITAVKDPVFCLRNSARSQLVDTKNKLRFEGRALPTERSLSACVGSQPRSSPPRDSDLADQESDLGALVFKSSLG